MRISARLDEDHARKLSSLASATHQGTTEILKAAIDVYYQQIVASRPRPAEILQAAGFVGCADGLPNLSETYKEELLPSLAAKHGDR